MTAEFYPDGRSLIGTVGLSRFRVLRHGQLDGYTVGKTERVDDVSLEEEAMEAAEVEYDAGTGTTDDSSDDSHDGVGSGENGDAGGGPSATPGAGAPYGVGSGQDDDAKPNAVREGLRGPHERAERALADRAWPTSKASARTTQPSSPGGSSAYCHSRTMKSTACWQRRACGAG